MLGIDHREIKNESQTFAFRLINRNLIPMTRTWVENNLHFNNSQIKTLIHLLTVSDETIGTPPGTGWTYISPGYNLAIYKDRLISLAWLDRMDEIRDRYKSLREPHRPRTPEPPHKRSSHDNEDSNEEEEEEEPVPHKRSRKSAKQSLAEKASTDPVPSKRPRKTPRPLSCPKCDEQFLTIAKYHKHQDTVHKTAT
jgi:hypothetical protein